MKVTSASKRNTIYPGLSVQGTGESSESVGEFGQSKCFLVSNRRAHFATRVVGRASGAVACGTRVGESASRACHSRRLSAHTHIRVPGYDKRRPVC